MASVSATAASLVCFRGIIVVAHAGEVNDSLAQTHPQHLAGEEGDEIIAAAKAAAPSPCSLSGLLSDICLQSCNYVIRRKRL